MVVRHARAINFTRGPNEHNSFEEKYTTKKICKPLKAIIIKMCFILVGLEGSIVYYKCLVVWVRSRLLQIIIYSVSPAVDRAHTAF